jgi:FkbM family methyltransferase
MYSTSATIASFAKLAPEEPAPLATDRAPSHPLRVAIRDGLAAAFRTVPPFKGKGRMGLLITRALTDFDNDSECMVTIMMRDRSIMKLDLRSFERLVFFLGNYDAREIALLSRLVQPEGVVLDVGANVGFYSIGLAYRSRAQRIVAFEPVPENFARLAYHVECNALAARVTPVNVALGNRCGHVEMHMTDRGKSSTGNAVLVTETNIADRPPSCRAAMTRLDDYAAENEITSCDLIKVDIEGAELEFLRGAGEFVQRTRPVIFSEYNPAAAAEFAYTFDDLTDLLGSWRYQTFCAPPRRSGPYVQVQDAPDSLVNFFAVPVERRAQVVARLNSR